VVTRPCPPPAPDPVPRAAPLASALERLLTRRRRRALSIPGHRAGVLLLLYDVGGAAHLVLTKRTDTVAHHRGQVCLPGGRWEPTDLTLRTTALRETEEELGVPAGHVRVVGALDDVPTRASDFIITPFIGVLERGLAPVPSPDEIARVLEVSVADLLAADALLPEDPAPLALRYPLLDEDVWGATARILRTFSRIVRCAAADAAAAGLSRPGPTGRVAAAGPGG
jgi:8-oxo-dGTP pyrophosphatase MutT (NUDIX family)